MTNTSEGPAGMSIEIMASLFCKGRESQIEMRNICMWGGGVHLYLIIEIYTSCSHDKYAYLENHFCSCDILISRAKNLLNLQIIRMKGKRTVKNIKNYI
jgi:hypothetical protein